MGCCFSCEEDDDRRRQFSSPPSRRAVPAQERYVPPQRPIVHDIRRPTPTASSTRSTLVPKPVEFKPPAGALYGEYKCHCGYFWVSRLSWRDRYQQCKRCKRQVRPRNQRELKPTDFISPDKFEESLKHPQELCEMCKQVGGYCGKYKQ
ncbi:hypothetical protein PYW08_014063 [Mythimna loreyi]|uniref:Uncharacterized protein n=1 Tax=Mythimna loreyi TaxID=667449 RepID=A0ACC2R7N2_9NEOP|nr:hypothetical protein PYW08_014063 [Mythimna loreyi]